MAKKQKKTKGKDALLNKVVGGKRSTLDYAVKPSRDTSTKGGGKFKKATAIDTATADTSTATADTSSTDTYGSG